MSRLFDTLSIQRRLSRAAAFAAVHGDEPPALYIELLSLRDLPFVEAAAAQRFPPGLVHQRRALELDDVAHDSMLLTMASKLAHPIGRV